MKEPEKPMFSSRRLVAAAIVAAGMVGFTALPAVAADTPTPTPTVTTTSTPTPTVTPTTPPVTQAKKAAQDIHITYVSRTVARLTWSDPSDKSASETVHYYVKTTVTLGGTAQASRITSSTTAHSITYRNVQPGSMLTPEVDTMYRKAHGHADKGSTYTQNQVVPSKPGSLTITVKNSKDAKTKPSITVKFKAPSTSGSNGTLIDGYRVRLYDSTTGGVVKTETLAKSERSASFAALTYTHGYYAQVDAHNSAGYGSVAKSTTVTTGAQAKPTPTASPTPTPTLLVTVPLPPVPQPTPTATPKPTVTAKPTAVPTATTPVSATPTTKATPPAAFGSPSDTRWFTISLIVAVSLGVLLSVGTFLYYRRHPRS